MDSTQVFVKHRIKSIHQKIRFWHVAYPASLALKVAAILAGLTCGISVFVAVSPDSEGKDLSLLKAKELGAVILSALVMVEVQSRVWNLSRSVDNWIYRQKEVTFLYSQATLEEEEFCVSVLRKISEKQHNLGDLTDFARSFLHYPSLRAIPWHEDMVVERLSRIASSIASDKTSAEICQKVFWRLSALYLVEFEKGGVYAR